LTKLETRYWR